MKFSGKGEKGFVDEGTTILIEKKKKYQGIFSFSEREKVGEEGYTLKLDLRRQSGIRRQRESVFLSFSQECNYQTQLFVFCRDVWTNDRNNFDVWSLVNGLTTLTYRRRLIYS